MVKIHISSALFRAIIDSTLNDDGRIFIVEIPNFKNCNFLAKFGFQQSTINSSLGGVFDKTHDLFGLTGSIRVAPRHGPGIFVQITIRRVLFEVVEKSFLEIGKAVFSPLIFNHLK